MYVYSRLNVFQNPKLSDPSISDKVYRTVVDIYDI
jgi:hypothetical protein